MKRNVIQMMAVAGLFMWAMLSCRKADDYKKYLVDGEIIYPAKPDSIRVHPGEERIMLSWVKSDPKVVRYVIYWGLGMDSLEVTHEQLGPLSQGDTVRVMINDLEEADYEFEVVSLDGDNNRSVKTAVRGRVYGELYRSALAPRLPRGITFIEGDDFADLWWYNADSTDVGLEIQYTNRFNVQVTKQVKPSELISTLMQYKEGTEIQYRSRFIPDSAALDTFYTPYQTIPAPQRAAALDKSTFAVYPLPGDVASAWGWELPYLWDNDINEGRGFHTPDVTEPVHFNIDLGIRIGLQQLRVWQRQSMPFDGGNLKKFEIWGSNVPSADGSFEGWTKLLECNSVKPSGLPVGSVNDEDVAVVSAGELFVFPVDTPPVRYVRIRFMDNWSETVKSYHMMEADFWGAEQ